MSNREKAKLIIDNKETLIKDNGYSEFKQRVPKVDAIIYTDAKNLHKMGKLDEKNIINIL
jgi:hypothetical protein